MPLLWISVFFIAGLALGQILPWSAWGWTATAGALLLAGLLLRRISPRIVRRSRLLASLQWITLPHPGLQKMPPIVLLAALILGAAWMVFRTPDKQRGHISALNDTGEYAILGVVTDYPDVRDRTTLLRLSVNQASGLNEEGQLKAPQPYHGDLLVMVPFAADYAYGDRLLVQGNPATPPEDEEFSYRAYLARQGIYTYLAYPRVELVAQNEGSPIRAAIFRLRDWAREEVYHLFPAPEAPLLAGILLGLDSDLPPALARAFQNTGTAHVIAISGFNIAILAGLFSRLFSRITSRYWAVILSILAIAVYTILVGATPSVVRAAIMGSLSLVAHQIGRRSAGLNTLFLTGGIMSIENTAMPWDPSFQLSFGATAGLIVFGDRFQDGFRSLLERRFSPAAAGRITGLVGEYVLLTLAAQLMTLPVILYHFQRLSVSSLLANPLVLPPQPLVMVLSGLAVLAGLVSDPLAHLLAWLAWPLSAYTIRVVELLDKIPGGVLVLDKMDFGTVVLLYAAILAPVFQKGLSEKVKGLIKPGLLLWCSLLLTAMLWRAVLSLPDGTLRLTVLDINHSQVLFIQGPGGENLLINGGTSASLLNDALGRRISPLDRRLDGLFITGNGPSEIGSLETLLERYPPEQVWWGGGPPKARSSGAYLMEALQVEKVPLHSLAAGEVITVGEPVQIKVLATTEEGAALLVTMNRFRVLIPGGVAPDQLPLQDTTGTTLLVLGPRDLKGTAPAEWMAIGAQAIVATPGESMPPETNTSLINTHPQGWVTARTDGVRLWMQQGD